MKKILILTVTAGNGHNSCAKSMKKKLESLDPNVDVKIVDLLQAYSNKTRTWLADKGYNIAVSKLLPIYNWSYDRCKRKDSSKKYKTSAMAVAKTTVEGLLKEIIEFQPDTIFCTHFYAGSALTALKLVVDIPCKTYITSLDYVNSPFWESCVGVDYFNVPNEDFVEENIREGFKKEQMLAYGFPVDERTFYKMDKTQAREALGIEKDMLTIMVMFGGGYWSGGFKIFKNLVKALEKRNEQYQIVMINGRNKKGYDKIQKMTFKDNLKVVNVGFTDKVPLYLSASDLILNKCGGLSATEMINQGLPMLITTQIPAQERYNLMYLQEKGSALSFKNKKQLEEGLYKLIDSQTLREEMSQKAIALKSNGIAPLAERLLQEKADYTEFSKQNFDLTKVKKAVKKALNKANKEEKRKKKEK